MKKQSSKYLEISTIIGGKSCQLDKQLQPAKTSRKPRRQKKTHHCASSKIRAHRVRQKRRRSRKAQALQGLTRAYLIVSAK
jgi:hypothetical protein